MNTGHGQPAGVDRLSVDLSPEVYDRVAALAESEGTTLDVLIDQAVASHKIRARQRIKPEGASLVPDHWRCRLRRHRGLSWTEETEPLPSGGTRTRVVEADCARCGRAQKRVRVVYPPSHTFNVTASKPEPAADGNAPEEMTSR